MALLEANSSGRVAPAVDVELDRALATILAGQLRLPVASLGQLLLAIRRARVSIVVFGGRHRVGAR
jgi:hypothetical protein